MRIAGKEGVGVINDQEYITHRVGGPLLFALFALFMAEQRNSGTAEQRNQM